MREQKKSSDTSGKPDKQTENKALQKYTREETKDKVLRLFTAKGDLNSELQHIGNDLLPKVFYGDEKERKEARKTLNENITPVLMGLEVDTHWGLMSAFSSEYWGMAKELSSQIIKEYNCTTHAEKMLVEVIVNAFIRTLDSSRALTCGSVPAGGSITENRTKYIAVLCKQIDRANRQFLGALTTLKQLKAPNIEMNIRAKTAFVSQNQQINAGTPNHETNES